MLSAYGDCVNQGRSERAMLFGVGLIESILVLCCCVALRMGSVEVSECWAQPPEVRRCVCIAAALRESLFLQARRYEYSRVASVQTPDWWAVAFGVLATTCRATEGSR